ncbi:MAG TPA: ornithine decarboxylase [Oceanospirillales bacterium]|nr:ornithine decarboxylase [Oceanospirillales bacterium]|tara:strand:- start:21921 stop:23084 length:1164 start_codon:yes stop_codon:yes gene_type:complete
MLTQPEDYLDTETFARIKAAADQQETPVLIVDTKTFSRQLDHLIECFPYAKTYYAVKANPEPEVLSILRDRGCNFDVASRYELDKVMALGVTADRFSYGNTIKKARDIQYFYEKGVRLYASDSEDDMRRIAENAPGSRVFVRILTEGSQTADWPLSRKFGCHVDMALELCVLARELGLQPYGISFHVGSQQRDIGAWDSAIAKVKWIFERLKEEHDIELKMCNLGGGFPANYISRTNPLETYAEEITRFLKDDFGDDLPEIILEPGRSLAGDSGVLVSEVIMVSRKNRTGLDRWVFTDIGKFGGFVETTDEAIKYPLYVEKSGETEEVIIAGPTCDSADILYEQYKYELPLSLASGDRLYWFTTGAYTTTYSAIEFNGFPPLKTICI